MMTFSLNMLLSSMGFENIKEIEKLNGAGVNTTRHTSMVYGELGQLPLIVKNKY